MLVKKNDKLKRDGICYAVICADEEFFIIGKMTGTVTSFEKLEAYSNDVSVNTLEELRFIKEE